ncbi:uncharacterized protein BKA78DRAFT_325388 [Phyllosticta capitalensis]|uniref:Uncharacterized protein n=1 Tax=Phyllosticta capitalensis TaxID=121624 RepID=A0ABR1YF93_9PEZI
MADRQAGVLHSPHCALLLLLLLLSDGEMVKTGEMRLGWAGAERLERRRGEAGGEEGRIDNAHLEQTMGQVDSGTRAYLACFQSRQREGACADGETVD